MTDWRVSGTYFEACNCDAICPCRRQGGRKLTTGSTYGVCDFALSWRIVEGERGPLLLSGLSVVLAGSYSDHEAGKPWRVCLYVDETASDDQHAALTAIFLGRAGGTTLRNYAASIGEVYAVRRANIVLEHAPRRWFMRAGDHVEVRGGTVVPSDGAVSCGIPGHDHPGDELRTEALKVEDAPLSWEVRGRCGFATDFDYQSDR
ncbi:MAG: DUF1326 domain-containing protein [Acidobacteria bacterium]|nr:DUF1326 domain-containing protein [Acidobacteriota bacterium]